jgi:hypothetical protein
MVSPIVMLFTASTSVEFVALVAFRGIGTVADESCGVGAGVDARGGVDEPDPATQTPGMR